MLLVTDKLASIVLLVFIKLNLLGFFYLENGQFRKKETCKFFSESLFNENGTIVIQIIFSIFVYRYYFACFKISGIFLGAEH